MTHNSPDFSIRRNVPVRRITTTDYVHPDCWLRIHVRSDVLAADGLDGIERINRDYYTALICDGRATLGHEYSNMGEDIGIVVHMTIEHALGDASQDYSLSRHQFAGQSERHIVEYTRGSAYADTIAEFDNIDDARAEQSRQIAAAGVERYLHRNHLWQRINELAITHWLFASDPSEYGDAVTLARAALDYGVAISMPDACE